MAQLAIRGHATRGKEVIEILEMLGGENKAQLKGTDAYIAYYICSEGYIDTTLFTASDKRYKGFTLEEFLEKYPYKVGDKVQHKGATSYGSFFEVEKMRWVDNQVKYTILWYNNCRTTVTAEVLQPYKEEPMYLNRKVNEQAEEIKKILEPVKEIMEEIKLDIPNGYEFFGIDDDNKIVLTKKQSQYPKTYEECCKIMGAKSDRHYCYTKKDKYEDYPHEVKLLDSLDYLRQLLICRDAYWKMAGEQMELGKPWKPDFTDTKEMYYIFYKGYIGKGNQRHPDNHILIFPTPEMRDAFYENFKELIEPCKELL